MMVLRILGALAGFALIYSAALLYEDEEGRVEHRMQTLWNQLRTLQQSAVGLHLGLLRASAYRVDRWLTRLYGERIVSLQAAAVSILLQWTLGVTLWAVLPWFDPSHSVDTFTAGLAAFMWGAFALAVKYPNWGWVAGPWMIMWILVLGSISSVLEPEEGYGPIRILLVATVCAMAIDIAVVAMLRALIRGAGTTSSGQSLLAPITGLVLAIAVLAAPPLMVFADQKIILSESAQELAWLTFFFGLSTWIPPGLLAVLLLTLGVHRLMWPLLLRPLYAVRRHRLLFDYRKSAIAVGASLVLVSWRPGWMTPLGRVILKQFGVEIPAE